MLSSNKKSSEVSILANSILELKTVVIEVRGESTVLKIRFHKGFLHIRLRYPSEERERVGRSVPPPTDSLD